MEQSNTRAGMAAQRRHHLKKRNKTAALGAAVLCFALVGVGICLFTLIRFGVKTVSEFAAPKETASYYEKYLSVVVGLDPQPYSSLKNANPDWMLETALWGTVSENTSGSYSIKDGKITVPTADILKIYEEYFGDTTAPNYHTISDNGVSFDYNSTLSCFYVPQNAVSYIFTPRVIDIERGTGTVTLTVQYLPTNSGWSKKADGTLVAPAPAKTMTYALKGSNGNYVISAIKTSAAQASSASGSSASPATSAVSTPSGSK
jgi:hypothetical protein